jgi:hypothetical protein
MFRQQFEIIAEHNYWTPCKKATYLIATLNELAAHIIHGVPTGATYEEVTEALKNRYGNHLEAAFHPQLKRRTQLVGESLQSLPPSLTTWLTMPTLNFPSSLIVKKPPVHSLTG